MEKNHTRTQLEIQGFQLDDEALTEIGPWMRWATAICASFMAVGTVLASPWVLWALATTALAGAFLPSHPFDYVYNYGVRHLTGTRPLPPNTPQKRFACGMAGAWLIGTGLAFFVGATTTGYVLGGVLTAMAALVATTHVCIPSMIYNAIFRVRATEPA